jgi:AAA+ superfamily predicted ATPase
LTDFGRQLVPSKAYVSDFAEQEKKRFGASEITVAIAMVASLKAIRRSTSADISTQLSFWVAQAERGDESAPWADVEGVSSGPDVISHLSRRRFSSNAILELDAQLRGGASAGVEVDSGGGETATATQVIAESDTSPSVHGSPSSSPGSRQSVNEALAKLDHLIGLTETKKQVRAAIATHLVNAERERLGLIPVAHSLNFVFTGSPGTGKTTVARIVAEAFAAAGLLANGKFQEVSKPGLVAEFVGQTTKKTMDVLKASLGGMLFVDEAYSLVSAGAGGYGEEALTTILQFMENHRSEISVVFAGYKDEMEFLIDSNAGLRSRFNTFISFPDYSKDELVQIFMVMASDHGIEISTEVREGVIALLRKTDTAGVSGNGRLVRNLFERMNERMSVRALEDGVIEAHELSSFQITDIPEALHSGAAKPKVGF